jgi:hypothetical protein
MGGTSAFAQVNGGTGGSWTPREGVMRLTDLLFAFSGFQPDANCTAVCIAILSPLGSPSFWVTKLFLTWKAGCKK